MPTPNTGDNLPGYADGDEDLRAITEDIAVLPAISTVLRDSAAYRKRDRRRKRRNVSQKHGQYPRQY